jgi:hypothetical protein
MTGYQTLVSRARGTDTSAKPKTWKEASAPAQVAKRVITGVFRRPVELDQADHLTTVMHWAYGIGWGGAYGLLQGTIMGPTIPAGAAFGTGVWAMSYVQLVPMGIYEPPWKYPPEELMFDLSYHLVYGLAAGLAFKAITRPG